MHNINYRRRYFYETACKLKRISAIETKFGMQLTEKDISL